MNKVKLNALIISLLTFVFTTFSFAQSDYEIVQNYKQDRDMIEQQLKNSNTQEELNLVAPKIEKLQADYSRHSKLLDNALYPEKFEMTIAKLNDEYHSKEGNFAAMNTLNVEVTDLKQRVDTLSLMNDGLQASMKEIELQFAKAKKETARLNTVVADLKNALHKRDVLVMNMVDSLMPPVMREKPMLSSEDKEQITSDVEKDNILVNVKTTIRDNIKYLDLTSLQSDDISEILEQQIEFSDTWKRIGPRLLEVYADDKTRAKEINEIDSLLTSWTAAVKQEAWVSIKEMFTQKGVPLDNFSDGEEFANSVNRYIDNEKINIEALPVEEAEHSFAVFVDSTWKTEIEPKWAPFLIEHGMLAETSKDAIEENIDVWRSELSSSNWWVWVIILGVFTSGLVLLLSRLKKNSQALESPTQ